MYCRTCGKGISDTASFCPNCGADIRSSSADTPNAALGQVTVAASHALKTEKTPRIFKSKVVRILCVILTVIVALFVFKSCGVQLGLFSGVEKAPKEFLTIVDSVYPGTKTTYKQAFDEFFDEPRWKFIEPEGDEDFAADFTGISKHDATQAIHIQLSWNPTTQEVYPNWMDINGQDFIEMIRSDADLAMEELALVDLVLDNNFTRSAFYKAFLEEVFSSHFVPELVEAERQKGNQVYTSFDEAFEGILLEAYLGADNTEEDSSSSESEVLPPAFSQAEPPEGTASSISENNSSLSLADKYPPVWAGEAVAIDYIGSSLGQIIDTFGTDFIISEGSSTTSYYLYYGYLPYQFYFQPYADTPSDEDVIFAIHINGSDGWIAHDLPVPSSQEELRYRLGMSPDADISNFYIGHCEVIMNWDSPNEPPIEILIKGVY